MKTTCAISMTVILFAYICFSACASDMPVSDKAVAVHLRLSEGWWIRINQDGSGSFGFGVLMDLVRVSKETFTFADVLDDVKRVFPRRPKYAEEPYMAVSYLEKQGGFVEEHRLAMDPALLTKLFILARTNSVPPANEIEKAGNDHIEEFWTRHPPISPNKPDSGDGK